MKKKNEIVTGYKCDPEKNINCRKSECYIFGGKCRITTNHNYAKLNVLGKPKIYKGRAD